MSVTQLARGTIIVPRQLARVLALSSCQGAKARHRRSGDGAVAGAQTAERRVLRGQGMVLAHTQSRTRRTTTWFGRWKPIANHV